MKRVTFSVIGALVLMAGSNDGVVAGSKSMPWKKSGETCAAPLSGCYGPVTGFAPSCDQLQCGAPGGFAPGCAMPTGAVPWFGAPMGIAGCSGIVSGDATWPSPAFGPSVGGTPMTPAYYAPVTPMTFTVPAIPAAEDLVW